MKWNEFDISGKYHPVDIIEKSIEGFKKATGGLLSLVIQESNTKNNRLLADFDFTLYLVSDFVSDYAFNVMDFGYNVELFPVKFQLESLIYKELFQAPTKNYIPLNNIEDEKQLSEFMEKVFTSKRFNEVVTGLMKIANKNKKDIKILGSDQIF